MKLSQQDFLVIDAALDLALKATGKQGLPFMELSVRVQQALQAGTAVEPEPEKVTKPEAQKTK